MIKRNAYFNEFISGKNSAGGDMESLVHENRRSRVELDSLDKQTVCYNVQYGTTDVHREYQGFVSIT